ncbi:TonB-dependent receptor plug domain-containing protein [Hyunsoonleella pacifica]|uniref:TonB-dependent receptor n=1 Tax=Hyunsoonleella pacifica TaxID=1080224 RepID=A0A4Q9FQA1_9FLAO|nr:TonB-dependent receptor [Hyunsoonleella pacifica]TBN15396.1 TonB-dependent receptor [Hyunsoonleella pacifica]GGD23716.1 TonB-dependent receptor [Hyunsoonleella pacifica]
MRQYIYILLFFVIGLSSYAQAQLDSIQKLDAVILSDSKLVQYASGIKIETLNDSVISNNPVSLTGLLAFNSNLYFKENGFGMVSSPSFRGTNASQTAVVWNGININSQLNGQTDFNTINTSNFDDISIRSGGGSVQYGSGAIGGSIHLNNNLEFNSHFNTGINLSYGSFNTKMTNVSTSYGNSKFTVNAGIAYVDSDNDYKYLGTDRVNENGEFNNLNLNVNLGYFISESDILKLYHQSYDGQRHFSGTLVAPSNSKFEDENYRTMLEWTHVSGGVTSKLKAVHLNEKFKYFENKDNPIYSFGKVNTFIVNHNFNLRLSNLLQFRSILELNYFDGGGSSFGNPERNAFSATAIMHHKPFQNFEYNINLRQGYTSDFKNPFLFSVDGAYKVSNTYTIQFNGSKNFRIPTFNDLYWQPGGNLDLEPESSYQLDLGHNFSFNQFNIVFNTYYIKTKDLIQWRPDNSGVWQPINIAKSQSYGAEVDASLNITMHKHNFSLNGHYSYTVSENLETKRQLIYVPFHKGNLSIAYNYKLFSMFYQHLFNGEVFIIGDELDGFNVANFGVGYLLNKKGKVVYDINLRINNIYNKNYQNVALRPMPNRNYQILTTIKF